MGTFIIHSDPSLLPWLPTAALTYSSILCGLTCGLLTVNKSLKKPCNAFRESKQKMVTFEFILVLSYMFEGQSSSLLVFQVAIIWRLCVHSLELNSSLIQISDFFVNWILVSIYLRCKCSGILLSA